MVHHKTTRGSLVELKTKSGGSTKRDGVQAGLTAQEGRSDRVGGLTAQEGRSIRVGHRASGSSEAEDTHRDCMVCVEVKQGAVAGLPV